MEKTVDKSQWGKEKIINDTKNDDGLNLDKSAKKQPEMIRYFPEKRNWRTHKCLPPDNKRTSVMLE